MVNIFVVRKVNDGDYKAILDIYSYYVANTAVSFEFDVPSDDEFRGRVKTISSRYPYIVAVEDGEIVGYAYGSEAYNERAACKWDSDVSVYVRQGCHGKGIGRTLYEKLEQMLKMLGYVTVYALITGENEGSCRFHEAMGYERVATIPKTGFKMGRWHDIFFYSKQLADFTEPESFPKTTAEIDVYRIL